MIQERSIPVESWNDAGSITSGYKNPGDEGEGGGAGVGVGGYVNGGMNGQASGLTMRHQNGHHDTSDKSSTLYISEKASASEKATATARGTATPVFLKSMVSATTTTATVRANGSSGSLSTSPTKGSSQNSTTPAQRRRRANLLRVWIERGLMVGMSLLAGYRMMTVDYNAAQTQQQQKDTEFSSSLRKQSGSWNDHRDGYHQEVAIPILSRSAWALGVGFILLALIHAAFLTAHDHRLQFPLHKISPLQPRRKRSSRYLNTNAPQAVADAAVAAESEDDSEDDDALTRERAADMQQEAMLLNQENANGVNSVGAAVGNIKDPVLGSFHSRFCRSAEGAMPQWRVWGSEAHWYRKGADNGSIFATLLVPVVLAAKFVQTVTDETFLSTGVAGIKTAESVLSNMAFSLIFGVSILVHMLLFKAFEDHPGPAVKSVRPSHSRHGSVSATARSTIVDSVFSPSAMCPSYTPSTSMSTNNLSTASGNGSLYPKYLSSTHRQQACISSPSSPSSPSLSATSLPVTSLFQQQQELQEAFIFSTEQLHHPSLLMGSSETERTSDREEIWIIALGFGGAYTCLVTLLARFKWIPGLEKTGAGMVMLNQNIFQVLMIGMAYFFRRSFTFGELVILAQAVTLLLHEAMIVNFISNPPTAGTVLEHPQFLFLLTLVVGMLLIGVILTPVLMYCRRLAQMPIKGASPASLKKREFKKKVSAGVVYTGLVAIVLILIMPRCERILGQNPFLWLIEFMLMSPGIFSNLSGKPALASMTSMDGTSVEGGVTGDKTFDLQALMRFRSVGWSRLGLCLYWALAVGCSITFFYWMNTSMRNRSIMGSLNNRRKYYHALAVLMFVPGYLTDEPFMHIAFSVGLAALIFLEYIRYFAVAPLGKEIHLFLIDFLDDRDGGPIILSHLYLLMGCAAPVWLAEHHILAGLSGIFALGVGDAMASIVGKRIGRHRWVGTVKTIEGTIAFVASVMVAAGLVFVGMWLMSFVFGDSRVTLSSPFSATTLTEHVKKRPASLLSFSTWNDWSQVTWSVWGVVRYGMAVSVAAMLEAVSEQNDNLVIPVVMLSMVWLI